MDRRSEFHNFVADLHIEKKYPGVVGYNFISLVKKEDLAKHIRKMKDEGFLDYAIFPSGERQEYAPVVYVEPFMRNMKSIGFDSFSSPGRHSVMDHVRDENHAGITEKIQLIQEENSSPQMGFVMYLPVYKSGSPYSTLIERQANIAGWVSAPIKMDEFMKGIMESSLFDGIDVEIYDNLVTETDPILFHAAPRTEDPSDRKNVRFLSAENLEKF